MKEIKPCPICGKTPKMDIDEYQTMAFIRCECGHGFVHYAPNRSTKVTEDIFPSLVEDWNVAASV